MQNVDDRSSEQLIEGQHAGAECGQTILYLDHAASSPALPEVVEAMRESLLQDVANPDGTHAAGQAAAKRINWAAEQVASALNADSSALVWTSGATESIDLALTGSMDFIGGGHIVTFATEHRATLDVAEQLKCRGSTLSVLGVDENGEIDLDELEQTLASGATLVSVMHVNNETGVMAPLVEIGALCARYDVLLHVDAAQSLGRFPLDVDAMNASLVSMSGHKTGGPKGIGALYVRPGVGLTPRLRGGGQQAGQRGGTRPTHQILGLGAAVHAARVAGPAERERLEFLGKRLWHLLAQTPGVILNGAAASRAPGFVNVSVDGVHGQALLAGLTLGDPALAVSPGSACSAARGESSHVLRAMGYSPRRAAASVRFSLGWTTETRTVERAATRFANEVGRLRQLAHGA